MKMEMADALAAVLTAVGYHAIAVRKSKLCRYLRYDLKYVCNTGTVIRRYPVNRWDMLLRDNERMNGSLRVYIVKSKAKLVLVNTV